jgi:hypothetical protein
MEMGRIAYSVLETVVMIILIGSVILISIKLHEKHVIDCKEMSVGKVIKLGECTDE